MASTTGFISESIAPYTGFLGGVGGELPDLLSDGNWEPYLPQFEKQNKLGLETLACVSFSRLNCCETQARFYGKNINLSDRSLAWASDTTRVGNTYSKVDFWLRQRGASDENCWPWVEPLSWEQYYTEPPNDIQNKMITLWSDWVLGMRVYVPITIEDLKKALKKGPLWFCTNDHSMMMYRVDDQIHIFDTYDQAGDGRKHMPLSYLSKIESAYIVPFTPKKLAPKPMINLPANSLVVVVDGLGERLMNTDGTKLYQDDAGKILLEVIARNAKPNAQGGEFSHDFPIIHLKTADIAGIPRYNLKGILL